MLRFFISGWKRIAQNGSFIKEPSNSLKELKRISIAC
jgi:hypothetical protein